MRFISHLDLVRLLQRALRRAGLPVTVTKGFTPRLKVSTARALKLGLASDHEEAVICMDEPVEPGKFIESINKQLPEGIKVTGAERENK
jgi:radical SAM-linked protein